MGEADEEPVERPATWENVVVGEVKEALGRALHAKDLTEEGEEQTETAREVREEFREEREDR